MAPDANLKYIFFISNTRTYSVVQWPSKVGVRHGTIVTAQVESSALNLCWCAYRHPPRDWAIGTLIMTPNVTGTLQNTTNKGKYLYKIDSLCMFTSIVDLAILF